MHKTRTLDCLNETVLHSAAVSKYTFCLPCNGTSKCLLSKESITSKTMIPKKAVLVNQCDSLLGNRSSYSD